MTDKLKEAVQIIEGTVARLKQLGSHSAERNRAEAFLSTLNDTQESGGEDNSISDDEVYLRAELLNAKLRIKELEARLSTNTDDTIRRLQALILEIGLKFESREMKSVYNFREIVQKHLTVEQANAIFTDEALNPPEQSNTEDRRPPCSPTCYHHVTHPCEKCGRLQGLPPKEQEVNHG